MKYDCLIIDDEKMLADSTAEYFNLFGVHTAAVYGAEQCRRSSPRAENCGRT